MAEFKMPSLGADMDAGRLLEWYVKPGDAVKRGDIVALVDTDKAAIEVEIFEDGVIGELLVPPGEKVPVGTPLATVLGEGEAPPAPAEAEAAAAEAAPAPAPTPIAEHVPSAKAPAPAAPRYPASRPAEGAAAVATPPPVTEARVEAGAPGTAERPHATPAARNHAREHGVDLATVTGTGKHGVITRQDVDAAARVAEEPHVVNEAVPAEEGRVRASPFARRMAERLGVDLTGVRGTGPGGAITWQDVEAAGGPVPTAPEPPAAAATETRAVAPPTGAPTEAPPAPPARGIPEAPAGEDRYAAMRRAIAAAMGKSKREIPHYYLTQHVDMRVALAWLEEANLARSVTERLLPATLLLKATALAVHDVPEVNGFYRESGFEPSEAVHLGVGISLRQGGLIAPAIHDADQKDLDMLMADLRDLVKRARSLQLRSSEMTDATITTTMLGDQGVESVYGIIYPPQVALVGFGRVVERPWAENGLIGVRPLITITLAADHRASDGHRGGLYLSAIERRLQHPEEL
ncbi:MAG: dihydrolipoamide acetyltransferase family protein [Deinococcales bacterium]